MASWEKLFLWSKDPYYGYVSSIDDALDLIQEYCYETATSYTATRATKCFGTFDMFNPISNDDRPPNLIRFEDDGRIKRGTSIDLQGVPFMVVGSKLMECHQGPTHRKKKTQDETGDHLYQQAAFKHRITGSKKRGCTASIYLREVLSFPQYKIDRQSLHHQRETSERLRNDLQSVIADEVIVEKFIYVDLPRPEDHAGHIMGDAANLKAAIDARVVDHINALVDNGVMSVAEMKRHVNLFVRTIFSSHQLPANTNRRFFPSRDDIRKMIYRRRVKNLRGLLDQEFLQQKINVWQEERPTDCWFYRPSASGDDEEGTEEQSFLLIYQSVWQKYLLDRYGTELVFLDATYRTTRYAIPLFFLCVQTNAGYVVVAVMLMEKEDSSSLSEALTMLADMNPKWKPKAFMIDASEIEMSAISQTFPESESLICDFHRKQAWHRWTIATKNNVSHQQIEILRLLNAVAESISEEEFDRHLSLLKNSKVWLEHAKLRTYIEKQWLQNDKYKKWVWAFRTTFTFVVHTNNGVEAQNKVFKHDFLEPYKSKSISNLMSCLVDSFLEDTHRRYLEANVRISEGWRAPLKHIPAEMHHRPQHLVRHMREAEERAMHICQSAIHSLGESLFAVKADDGKNAYKVSLGSEENQQLPFCECRQFRKTHLPCKHFAAIFRHIPDVSWNSLPTFYKDHPLITVDQDCVGLSSLVDCPVPEESTMEEKEHEDEIQPASLDESIIPSAVHRHAKNAREVLARVHSLTFLVESVDMLKTLTEDLKTIEQKLVEKAPKSDSLLLESDPPQKTKQRIKELKKRKRRHEALHTESQPRKRKFNATDKENHKQPKIEDNQNDDESQSAKGETINFTQEKLRTAVDGYEHRQPTRRNTSILIQGKSKASDYDKCRKRVTFASDVKSTPPKGPLNKQPNKMSLRKAKGIKTNNIGSPSKQSIKITDEQSDRQDGDRLIDILSTIPKAEIVPKAGIRYHVFGEVLDNGDFQSLKGNNWLTDTVMNAYLLCLKAEQNVKDTGHIYVLPSYMAVLWSNGHYESFLHTKIQLSLFEWIFMAMNVNNNHWVLLAANVPSKKVSILDSLNNNNQNLIRQWKKYMQIRGNQVGELTEWRTGDLVSCHQNDGSSCGPFTLMNALAIVNSIPTISLSQRHALRMREFIANKLLSVAKVPPAQRKTCDMVGCSKPGLRKPWICCDVCARWSHYICVNIAKKPRGDYVCPVCEAQYQ